MLDDHPFEVRSIRLLTHGFNTTFRVDTAEGERFALRIAVNSRRAPEHLRAEVAWLGALARDTDLRLPVPQHSTSGEVIVDRWCEVLGRSTPSVLFSWLPGPDLGDRARPEQIRAAGRATAVLHAHAAEWRLPDDAALPSIASILMETPNRFGDDLPLLTDAVRAVIDESFRAIQGHFDALLDGVPLQPLHADLHTWNLKWWQGELEVFDFDDSGLGAPAQDLAISTYYLRDDDRLVDALLDGYTAERALPSFTDEQFEAVVASRNLVLLNDILVTENAEFRAFADRYVANAVAKLRHYLETGRYRHDVPGVVPLG